MNPPLLKLAFVKGPRDGESMEFKPGSTIRVGRIVSGNEIAIKDKGISTKHLRIDSDSENWIIRDRGSSNGTELNSDILDPENPVVLRHGDTIKLGEDTSFVVNFVSDHVHAQEHKLPPRPRRNNKRRAVADPDPVESSKHEVPKRSRAWTSQTLEGKEPVVNSRVTRSRKKKSEANSYGNVEVAEDEKENSIKLETEDTPKEDVCLGMENVKSEDTALKEKDDKRTSRATRSKKKEIGGGDSLLELEMVLKQARKSRAEKKKMEKKLSKSVVEMEVRNDDAGEEALNFHAEEDKENAKDNKTQKEGCTETSDDKEAGIENARKNILGETENLQDTIDCKNEEAGIETCEEEKVESSNKKVELEKMRLGEWFDLVQVQLPKLIIEETEKLIEPMRSKALRVHKYIAEQKPMI